MNLRKNIDENEEIEKKYTLTNNDKLMLRGSLRDYFYTKFDKVEIIQSPIYKNFLDQTEKDLIIKRKHEIINEIAKRTIEKEYLQGIFNTVLKQVKSEYDDKAKEIIESWEIKERQNEQEAESKRLAEYQERRKKEGVEIWKTFVITDLILIVIHSIIYYFIISKHNGLIRFLFGFIPYLFYIVSLIDNFLKTPDEKYQEEHGLSSSPKNINKYKI